MHFQHIAGFLFALTAFSKPLQHGKRYDLDCNGTPDWCYVEGDSACCLLANGSWTSFPATWNTMCPTTGTMIASTQSVASLSTETARATSSKTGTRTTTTITQFSLSTSSKTGVIATATPAGSLPPPAQFKTDRGQKWTIELQGNLTFTGLMGRNNLGGDKGRTGKIGDKIVWNFGDMECAGDWTVCGFSMGPAFYGTCNVMVVNTFNVTDPQSNDFVLTWAGDPAPQAPHSGWGMDASNVAEINSTHGVVFAWEIWRGTPNGSISNRGNAAASVTLAADRPVAQRVGPLLTGPTSIQLGLLAIIRDGSYIYTYSVGGPSNIIVGRVPADDSVFDTTKHEFLLYNTFNSWISGIPLQSDKSFGATTMNPGGRFGCGVYGSVFYNTYLQKYIILCDIFVSFVNMYTSDTPFGPWSAEYSITSTGNDGLLLGSYGSMAHPQYGNGKEWYFSIGPTGVFQVFKVTFGY